MVTEMVVRVKKWGAREGGLVASRLFASGQLLVRVDGKLIA